MNALRSVCIASIGIVALAWLSALPAQGEEEVTVENGVLVVRRDFSNDMPAFSPDGKLLALWGWDRLRVLELLTGQRIRIGPEIHDQMTDLVWTPDGTSVISHGEKVIFWDVATARQTRQIRIDRLPTLNEAAYATSVAISPDGKSLALGFHNGTIIVTGMAYDANPATLLGHSEKVSNLIWRGETLYSAGGYGDGAICIWSPKTRELVKKFTPHRREVKALSVHPKEESLLSLGDKNELFLLSAKTGETLLKFQGAANAKDAVFAANGDIVISSHDNELVLWKTSGERIRTIGGHDEQVRKIEVSPDGKLLASAGGSTVRVRRLDEAPASSGKPVPNSADFKDINRLDAWEVKVGDWTQKNRRLIGTGNSQLVYKKTFPNDFTFRFKMRELGQTNVRVRFGSFHFGHEGPNLQLFLHGPKAAGTPFPYEVGEVVRVEVQMSGDEATLRINDKEVAKSNPKVKEERSLTLEGGGRKSQGATEFFDLELATP